MKSRFEYFISHKSCWITALFAFIINGFHIYQFIDSGFMVEPAIRMGFNTLLPFLVFFFKENIIPFYFAVFGLALEQFITFENYTCFFMVSFLCITKRKFNIPILALYAIGAVIRSTRLHNTPVHLIMHLINCTFIMTCIQAVMQIVRKSFSSTKRLVLTDDEMRILSQKIKGMNNDSIEGYSRNTVSRKLSNAARNNHITVRELIERYREECKIGAS